LGLVEKGLEYTANSDLLNVFVAEIANLDDDAFRLQYSPYAFTYNLPISNRLSQVLVGELTLDEAIVAIQEDVDAAIASAQ
jgi:alpha-1,4-digalacturonate transport system substrate-binding protein